MIRYKSLEGDFKKYKNYTVNKKILKNYKDKKYFNKIDVINDINEKSDVYSVTDKNEYFDDYKDLVTKRYKTRIFWNSNYNQNINTMDTNANGISSKVEYNEVCKNQFNFLEHLKFKKCLDKRCKTCLMINSDQIDSNSDFNFCKTYNCVYMMKCKICSFKYIGQTSNTINLRINQHRSDTKKFKDNNCLHNNIEIGHFNLHGFQNVEISIIKIVPNQKDRLWWENYFIDYYNSIYPYGLNTLFFGKNILQSLNNDVTKYFYKVDKSIQVKRFGKSNKARKKRINRDFKTIYSEIMDINQEFNIDFNVKKIKRFLFGLNKKELKLCNDIINDNIKNSHGWVLIKDILKFLFKKHNIKYNGQEKKVTEYCTFLYMNKNYDKCNFSAMLSKHLETFPIKNIQIKRAFKYGIQLGRMIFNYNKVQENNMVEECNCKNYENFINNDHGHVITGDLNIVEGDNLRELMERGTKHRLMISGNEKYIKEKIKKDFDTFLLKIAIKYNLPIEAFNEYRSKTLEEIFKINFKFKSDNNVRIQELKKQIVNLQKDFVIVYIDKVPGNFAIICKYFYKKILNDHLTNSNIYSETNVNEREILKRIQAFHKRLGLNFVKKAYPHIFMTPKFHKNPIKFRSVTNGCNTYITKPGKILQNYLQTILMDLKEQGKTIIINNSAEIFNDIKNIKITSVNTFDFQDLFNSIDIEDLILILVKIHKEFELEKHININKFKTLIHLVLKENYVYFDNKLFHQIKGLPQGGPASNSLANLYLHFYEKNCNNCNNVKQYRYIDDLIVLNKESELNTYFDFYPQYLVLLKTNSCQKTAEFLDLDIKILDEKIDTNIYDKRNDFNFNINKLPFWDSNISLSVFKNLLKNYIIRNNRLVTTLQNRKKNIKNFIDLALEYGYPQKFIYTYIDKKYLP